MFSLLTPFKSISCIFYPIIEIKRLNLIHHKEEIDRLYYINKRFCDILGTETHKEGTVEYYTGCWIDSVFNYINRLDALLLTHGIDLLMIQKKCGICLKGYRSIHEIDYYIGSIELTQYYIDKLPQREPPNKPQEKDLPNELNTSEFRKIFRPSSSKEQ